jgi:hypothetical protein
MLIFAFLFTQMNTGYLNVTADQDSLPVYVDNAYVGKTPITKYPLPPERYTVGFFPEDSVEAASWQLKNGSINALWRLAKYSEGVVKIEIAPNKTTTVRLDHREVMSAPGRAKLKVAACLGGTFILGVLSLLAIQAVF